MTVAGQIQRMVERRRRMASAIGGLPPIQSLFADGTDGYWFADADYARLATSGLARLYLENTGRTPATAVTNNIGLMLDEHSGAAVGAEKHPDGGFDVGTVPTGWTQQAGDGTLSVVAGELTLITGTVSGRAEFAITGLTVGRWLKIAYSLPSAVSSWSAIELAASAGGSAVASGSSATQGSGAQALWGRITATTMYLVARRNGGGNTCKIDNVSIKEVSGNHGIQATGGSRPTIQETGGRKLLRFDALDDCFLTPFLAQNGANSIIAKVTVPASLAGTQVIAGSSESGANRCFLAINTSGQICGGVGSQSATTIVGTTDLRGLTVVVGLAFDGSTVKLFVDTAEEYSAAQSGAPTTTIAHDIGASNSNGTAANFWGGDIWHAVGVRKAVTLAQFTAIRSQMNAA